MNKNLEKLIDEMSDKFVKGFDFKTRGVSYRNHGFKEGAKAMHDLMIDDMKKLLETYDENKKLVAENEKLKEEIFNLKCEMSEWEIDKE